MGRLANVPKGQGVQEMAPVPSTPVLHPAGQLRHLLPVPASRKVPLGHCIQLVAPAPAAFTVMLPAGQEVQVVLLAAAVKVPTAQALQVLEPSPSAKLPAALQVAAGHARERA